MLKIRLGKDLAHGACSAPTSALGSLTTAPTGLLDWLESQLGLSLPTVSFTARMVLYLNCLREHDTTAAFYHASFERDEFGVATTLLQWRDTWYEAGWTGEAFDAGASQRLIDLAAVERTAKTIVPPNLGQRVQRVLAALDDTPLEVSVTLLDPPEAFPAIWQQLFAKLDATTDVAEPTPRCSNNSDLAALQKALVGKRKSGEQTRLNGDGSVLVLRDGSPQLSAPWVARFAHLQLTAADDVALLAREHGPTLDDALADAGLPQLGLSAASFWRPPFQVLPLALEMLWRPLDPSVLLQFLAHPMGPVPSRIRRRLANVVSQQPGIGGDDWLAAVREALDRECEDDDDTVAQQKRERNRQKIDFWLNTERFDPVVGVTVEVLRQQVRAVSDWLGGAAAAQEDEALSAVYAAALEQSDEVLHALDRLGQAGTTTLPRESVRRLVEAVRGRGTPRPGRPWQCAPGAPQLLRGRSPAEFLQPVDTLLWWGCDDERLPQQHPWSDTEQRTLAEAGVQLVPINTLLEWQAQTWLRPILAATKRLVLILHDNAEGHHPVFDEIVAVAEGWTETRIDRLMRDSSSLPFDDHLPATQTIPQRGIPAPSRWWRLPEGTPVPPRETESFSSLEKFLFYPHQWLLNYQARIRPGALAELTDNNRLKGALAHALFERFFAVHPDIAAIKAPDTRSWARTHIDTLIEQQGAVLLKPGRQGEKEYFVRTVTDALVRLVEHVQAAGVTAVEMETELPGRFCGGAMNGTIDLIASRAGGEQAVIDIKWGGLNYREESLAASQILQLAVYAQLANERAGRWPDVGYFIIRDARLLMFDSDYFPNATVVRPANGENYREFWQRAESTWRWRREQFDRGLIEVPVAGTEPDEDSSPDESGLPMPDKPDKFDDYTVLTGWGDGT